MPDVYEINLTWHAVTHGKVTSHVAADPQMAIMWLRTYADEIERIEAERVRSATVTRSGDALRAMAPGGQDEGDPTP